jgi:hypothetical protein
VRAYRGVDVGHSCDSLKEAPKNRRDEAAFAALLCA